MDDSRAVVIAVVERGEGQDEVVDFGGGYTDGKARVGVCGGGFLTACLGTEHACGDVAVDVDVSFVVAGKGSDASEHGEDDGEGAFRIRDEGDVGHGGRVDYTVDCCGVIVAWEDVSVRWC